MVRTKTNRLLQHHARNAFSCLYSGYSLIVFPRVFLGSSTSFVLILFSFNDNMGDRFSRISNCIISVHPILCIRSCWRDACNSDSSSRSRLYTTLFSDSTRSQFIDPFRNDYSQTKFTRQIQIRDTHIKPTANQPYTDPMCNQRIVNLPIKWVSQ